MTPLSTDGSVHVHISVQSFSRQPVLPGLEEGVRQLAAQPKHTFTEAEFSASHSRGQLSPQQNHGVARLAHSSVTPSIVFTYRAFP